MYINDARLSAGNYAGTLAGYQHGNLAGNLAPYETSLNEFDIYKPEIDKNCLFV